MSEMATQASRMCSAMGLPLIADADTGYGGVLNVRRTVQEYERAGVAALHIEDQVFPKRCGHFAGKAVIPMEEMVGKIRAALEARTDPDLVIIARTDSRAVEGFDAAIRRAHAYEDAGADMLFVEAPQSIEEMRVITSSFRVPLVANMVEGGATPILPDAELGELGYKVVLHAGSLLRDLKILALRAGFLAAGTLRPAFSLLGAPNSDVTKLLTEPTVRGMIDLALASNHLG